MIQGNPSLEFIQHSSTKRKEGTDFPETNSTKQTELYPPDRTESLNQYGGSSSTEEDSNLSKHARQSVEKSNSPVKLQSLFGCNCIVDDYLYSKTLEEYCLSNGSIMRNSTPNESIDEDKMATNMEDDSENSKNTTYHSCLDNNDQSIENETAEFTMDDGLPLIQKLLQNNLNILKNIRRDDRELENNSNDKPTREIFKISGNESSGFSRSYAGQYNASVDVQSLSNILKDLSVTRNVVTNFGTLKVVESNERRADDEIQKAMVSMSVTDNSMCLGIFISIFFFLLFYF